MLIMHRRKRVIASAGKSQAWYNSGSTSGSATSYTISMDLGAAGSKIVVVFFGNEATSSGGRFPNAVPTLGGVASVFRAHQSRTADLLVAYTVETTLGGSQDFVIPFSSSEARSISCVHCVTTGYAMTGSVGGEGGLIGEFETQSDSGTLDATGAGTLALGGAFMTTGTDSFTAGLTDQALNSSGPNIRGGMLVDANNGSLTVTRGGGGNDRILVAISIAEAA